MPKGETFSHDSYGMISVSRVSSSNTELFGSDITHNHFITLTISKAEVRRDLGRSWFFGRNNLIRINLTNVQFAEMLTSMNTNGVPCTIEYSQGKSAISYKPVPKEIESVYDESIEKILDPNAIALTNEAINTIRSSKLSKTKKLRLKSILETIKTSQKRSADFYFKSFVKSANKVLTESKASLEAARIAMMDRLGLERLDELKNKKLE